MSMSDSQRPPDAAPQDALLSEAALAKAPRSKAPAPGLYARAPRPVAVRLRRGAVQAAVGVAALLVAGALAWAFVIQPEMRAVARERGDQLSEDTTGRSVRPAEIVTDQPDRYDRLPEPRGRLPQADLQPQLEARSRPGVRSATYATPSQAARPSGPRPAELAARSALFFEGPDPQDRRAGSAPPSSSARPGVSPDGPAPAAALPSGYNLHRLSAPVSPYELKAGALIPAALLTALDTSRAGPVVGVVVEDVYDTVAGRHLLVPRGSRLIGKTEGRGAYGDRRAFLTWERLILPNGKSVTLTEAAAVDAQGAVGVRGQVDRRLLPLLTGTLFAGAVTALGQMARDDAGGGGSGWLGSAGDAAAIEGAQVGGRLIDRELEVRPSLRLAAGAPVRVLITRDLILEPYAG